MGKERIFSSNSIGKFLFAAIFVLLAVISGAGTAHAAFGSPISYGAGNNPRSVFAADFNGDGKPDLAVANYGSGNVSVLLNNGNGTFAAAVNYAAGAGAWSVFAGDFDGDGDFDLAITNSNADTISVLLNNGTGTFAAHVNYAVQDVPASVYVADFNGDGKLDLAVANYFGATVSVLINNGTGTFAPAVNYEIGNWSASLWDYPIALSAADLNGDGHIDISTANYDNNTVSVLLNNGDGTFAASVDYAVGSHPASVFSADLNGDGQKDLVAANYSSNNVSVLINNGNGTFASAVNYPAGSGPWSVFAADIEGDSDLDLAVADYGSARVSVLLSNVSFPVPTTASINPSSVLSSSSAFTLTVKGTNFFPSSTVQWNGSNRVTTFVSSTQLTAVINAGDITLAGTSSITVVNPTPGGGTSNAQVFTVVGVISSPAYTAWTDHGVGYTAPSGDAYYPSVIYDANGFGGGTPKYKMWYANGSGSFFLATSTDGVVWGAPTTMAGITNIHHTQVIYDANCFGTVPCNAGTTKYRIWFWDMGAPTIYSISSMATAESSDGINWINKTAVTQNPAAKLVQSPDSGVGWNRGTYGPVSMFYQPSATSTGTEPWNYKFVMYYDGTDGGHEDTGLAYSADGLTWSAYTANPVLDHSGVGGSEAWDCVSAVYGTVFKDSAGYHYIFSGKGQDNGSGGCAAPSNFNAIGYASSVDGKTWVKDTNSIFKTSDGVSYRAGRIYTPSVINDGSGILRMYFSVTDSTGTPKKIGYATLSIVAGPTAEYFLSHPGTMFARTRVGYTVTRKDSFANAVTSGTSTVDLYTNSSGVTHAFYSNALSLTPITSVDISNGQSFASFYYYDDTAGTVTITASDNPTAPDGATGIADGTDSLVVEPVAVKFVIIQPSDGTVDAPISVTVQAQKPDNSVDTNYQDDVTLSATGLATSTGGGLIDIINGVGTKNISDTVAETVTLSLADSQTTGLDVTSSAQVTFGVGALAQYSLNHPGSIGAGTRATYTVTRQDQYGNLITSGNGAIYLYSNSSSTNKTFYDAASAGNVITSTTIMNGQSSASFWYYDDILGDWTITGSDNTSTPDGNAGVIDAADSLAVVPGAVASFTLNHPGTIFVGTRATYTVTRKDAFSNLVTSGSNEVYLYSASVSTSTAFYPVSSGGGPITFISIDNGFSGANFWYEDGVAGIYTITGSDNGSTPDGVTGIADGTDSLIVSPAPIVATRFVILDPPVATTDAAATVTVQAQDNSGRVDTIFNGSVTLNTTGSAQGGGTVTITNGIGTKDITDAVAQSVTLTLTDTGGTGLDVSSSKILTFAPGALAQFSISSPGDVAAGARLALTVVRKDQFGNGVTDGLTVGYLYSDSTNPNQRFFNSASGGSAITFFNFTSGVSSTQVWYYDETAATTTVTISDNATSPDGLTGVADASAFVHVVPGITAKFILSDPGSMFVGTRAGYTVTRKDQFDNLVTSGVNLAYLWSNSTGANEKFYDSATGGLIITSIAVDDTYSSANFWYFDEEPGTWTITASNNSSGPAGTGGFIVGTDSITVSLVPIVATRLVILPAGPSQVGSPTLVTIQAGDNSSNVETTFNNSVTLDVNGSATGGGVINIVNGIGVASVNDLAAETVILSLTDSNSTGLDVSSVQNLLFTTAPVLQPGLTGTGAPVSIAPIIGGVIFSGRAYPGASLSIVSLGEEAVVIKKSTVARADGFFEISFSGIATGARAYGLLVQDKEGRISQTKIYDVYLRDSSNVLEINNILVSPTIGFSRGTVTKGDRLIVVGYSAPGSTINFLVDGKLIIEKAQAGVDGSYRVLLRTGDLAFGSHTIKGTQTDINGRISDSSTQRIFTISNLLVPQMDFNSDGKVNITDASIFLSRFNSADPKVKILNDVSRDGKVDVTDFSIFLRTLRLQR